MNRKAPFREDLFLVRRSSHSFSASIGGGLLVADLKPLHVTQMAGLDGVGDVVYDLLTDFDISRVFPGHSPPQGGFCYRKKKMQNEERVIEMVGWLEDAARYSSVEHMMRRFGEGLRTTCTNINSAFYFLDKELIVEYIYVHLEEDLREKVGLTHEDLVAVKEFITTIPGDSIAVKSMEHKKGMAIAIHQRETIPVENTKAASDVFISFYKSYQAMENRIMERTGKEPSMPSLREIAEQLIKFLNPPCPPEPE